MEAATRRPALEPLSELPVETPLDPGSAPAAATGPARNDLIDPDALLSGTVEPALAATQAPAPAAPPSAEPESEVQDLALLAADELPPLEALTPPPPPQPSPPAVDPAGERPTASAAARPTDHTKLRGALRLASKPRPKPTAEPPGASAAAPAGTSAAAGAREKPKKPTGAVAAPKAERPTPTEASGRPAATLPVPTAAPAANAAAPVNTAASMPAGAPMDRDFIVRNQIVERYLSGRLPLKGASDFERFCREQPQYLDEIGLSDRVNDGLRLLEAGGKPEPWQEAPRPIWQKPQVPLVLGALVVALGIALAVVGSQSAGRARQVERLKTQAAERPLDPATSTREIRLLPSREGASNNPAIVVGGGPAQLIDLKIDESRSPYKVFRVTIDRIDQGRVAVLGNLLKDSNGHLRIALNSSAFGPGNYQFTIEGLTWRGEAEPDSWITLGVQH